MNIAARALFLKGNGRHAPPPKHFLRKADVFGEERFFATDFHKGDYRKRTKLARLTASRAIETHLIALFFTWISAHTAASVKRAKGFSVKYLSGFPLKSAISARVMPQVGHFMSKNSLKRQVARHINKR